ncbi:transcriptional regulator [Candidatus Woesearchaeota archaeon]|nr:transcriptional regulator [Candidatus Woesearchaeota archaeon]
MTHVMPQEIEVWYLLPSIRKALAKSFVHDFQLKQKDAARLLGITEAAVSQYLKDKRGAEINFTIAEKDRIRKTARSIIDDGKNVMKLIYDLCASFRGSKTLCCIHRKHDKSLPKNCRICLGG